MATEAKVEEVIVAVPSNQEYVDGIKSAPAFGIKDKLGYMFGDLGFIQFITSIGQYVFNDFLREYRANYTGTFFTYHRDL